VIKHAFRFSLHRLAIAVSAVAALGMTALPAETRADETSCSPFTPLIMGQEEFVYVWTLGVEGVGDGSDKLVTVDVNPMSKTYGKVIASLSVGGRNEVHHAVLSDDRRYLWGGGLDSSKIFVFDIHTDPAKPKLTRVIDDFVEKSGGIVGQVRLVSLSFDPVRDTPEVLALYAGDNARGGRPVEWAFLTTGSVKDLLPILDGFGQDVFLDTDPASGAHLGTYSHVLKVFLIDRDRMVREIYTTAYLMPDMVYNDIVTLLLEAGHKLE
jgi:hypothetical protein